MLPTSALAPFADIRPVPDRPRLRDAALHRAPDTLQFGADPSSALVVDGLTPPLVRMIEALDGTRPVARVLADAVAAGAAPATAHDLLARLHAAGLVLGAAQVDSLADRRVLVHGAGRIAVSVACLLAAAGVGRVLVEAQGTVVRDDVGTGLLPADVGRPSAWAAEQAVARASTGPAPPDGAAAWRWLAAHADLVVLADGVRPDPVAAARLVVAGRAHLPVSVVDGVGAVGPLVVPGTTPCLQCEDLRRTDLDPAWPRVAAELAGQRVTVPVARAAAIAALAVSQALAHLEGVVPAAWGATLVLDPDGAHRPHPARRRSDCGCSAVGRRRARGGGEITSVVPCQVTEPTVPTTGAPPGLPRAAAERAGENGARDR